MSETRFAVAEEGLYKAYVVDTKLEITVAGPFRYSEEAVYAVATGQSDDMQFAIDKAMHDAKVSIADKLQNYVNGDFTRVITDSGSVINGNTSQKTTKITQSIIDELPMGGYVVENKVVKNEGNSYRAFVLVTFDVSNWSPPVKITQVDQGALDAEIAGSDVIQ